MTQTSLPQSAPSAMVGSLPPGRYGLPLLGETLQFLLDPNFARKRYDRYGPIFKTHLLGVPTVMMVGPEAVRLVLSSQFDHFSWGDGWPQTFKDLLGRSLFVQDGPEHHKNRKLIMPAFHGKALSGYLATLEELTKSYLAKWEQQGQVRLFDENKQLTFEIASRIFLGTHPGEDTGVLSRLFHDLTGGLLALTRWEGGGRTTFGRAMAARRKLLDYVTRAVEERRRQPGQDALSLLVQARDEDGQPLSTEELAAQAMLLLFAGHETTTSMITSTLYELARHPAILAQARQEQADLGITGPLTLEQVGQMTYLEHILREVERLHPPVAGGFRGVIKDFDFNGYHVPAGWRLQYTILATQQVADNYTDPQRFEPSRFEPGREEHKQQAFSLIGFGGGPRLCVGAAFAQLEMKVILSHLLRYYEWELQPGPALKWSYVPTLHPKNGLPVSFKRRPKAN